MNLTAKASGAFLGSVGVVFGALGLWIAKTDKEPEDA